MAHVDIKVPSRYYTYIAGLLAPQGIDFDELLRSVGLSPKAFSGPNTLVKFSQVDRLLQRASAVSGRTDLGFRLGQLISVSTHTFVGFAMLNSATLDEALRFEARYFRLVMPSFSMYYASTRSTAELHFAPLVPIGSLCLSLHLEGVAMAVLREISDLVDGQPPDAEIDYSMPTPEHAHLYRKLAGVKARFGTEATPGVRIRLLDNPRRYTLPIADSRSLQLAEDRCKALLKRTTGEHKFARWVEMTLREVSEGLPTLEELAGLLSISKRTLNRYLETEGTSYRTLAKRIQHELACERLTTGGMTASEVAHSLGFTELSNFSRAFRSRAGCSPSEYARNASSQSH